MELREEEEAVTLSGPCEEFRKRTQRDKESKKSRGGEKEEERRGRWAVRSSVKVQLRNSIPRCSTMRNEIKLNLDLFGSSPHLCRRRGLQQTRAQTPLARAPAYARASLRSPLPCQRPSWEIRRLETGQPWPMYIFMGLIWHHFSPLPEKRNVFNLHNPHLACSPRRETYRESRTKVRVSPLQQNLCCGSVCRYVCACARAANCVCAKGENRNISSYSRPVQ